MSTYWSNIRSMTRNNWSYVFGWSAISFAQFGFATVLFNFYLLELGFTKAQIGGYLGIGNLAMALGALPAGYLGARAGPRKTMEAGFLVMIAAWLLLVGTPFLPGSAWTAGIVSGTVLNYLGFVLILVNGVAYFMQISTAENRIFLISFQQLVQGAMGILGSILAGILPGLLVSMSGGTFSGTDSIRAVLLVNPLLYTTAYLVLRRSMPVAAPAAKQGSAAGRAAGVTERFPAGVFAYYALIVLLLAAAWAGVMSFFNLYLKELGYTTEQVGSLLSIGQFMPFLAAAAVPLLSRRLHTGAMFGLSSLFSAACALVLSASSLPLVILACLVVDGFARAVMNTVRALYGQQLVDQHYRTYISAAGAVAISIGFALASSAGGVIIQSSGYGMLFILSAAFGLASGVITLAYPLIVKTVGRKAPAAPVEAK